MLLGRKAMTNLDRILKSKDMPLADKGMVFPIVMYGCESWTIKKPEHPRIDAFELWCWRNLLRVPWTANRSNQSILKEINPEYSLEGLMLKLNSNILTTWWEELTDWKRPLCWQRLKAGGEGDNRGWNGWMAYWLDRFELEQALGEFKGQGSLASCSPWGSKESDMTERQNSNNILFYIYTLTHLLYPFIYQWIREMIDNHILTNVMEELEKILL